MIRSEWIHIEQCTICDNSSKWIRIKKNHLTSSLCYKHYNDYNLKQLYNHNKFHAGIPIPMKCYLLWHDKNMCPHQITEIDVFDISKKFILKRDFNQDKSVK